MKQGKRAIVVGASSGIGLEVTKLMMRQGWTVGVAARRVELLQDLGAAAVECIDVTKDDATESLQRLIRKLGGMDLYFHASGIGKQNRELTADIELATVETNEERTYFLIDIPCHPEFVKETLSVEQIGVKGGVKGPNVTKDVTKELTERQSVILEMITEDSFVTIPEMSLKTDIPTIHYFGEKCHRFGEKWFWFGEKFGENYGDYYEENYGENCKINEG